MKASSSINALGSLLAIALATSLSGVAQDATEQAGVVKEKIQNLRSECAEARHQITRTTEELKRLTAKNVELRPQFEKYKAELTKMQEKAENARKRADMMKSKGAEFFNDWETQVRSIRNEDIRKAAEKRLAKRKKSYEKILTSMQDAKEQLVPFMSDLNDIKKLLDAELTASSVASAKDLIRQANWHGEDVLETLTDVEKELDRVAAELAKYQ
jgi:chromosome segregation ATPase